MQKFFNTFIENSKTSRVSLFQDAFFQHLWTNFAKTQQCYIENFLRSMSVMPMGRLRLERFFADVDLIEERTNFKVIPLQTRIKWARRA